VDVEMKVDKDDGEGSVVSVAHVVTVVSTVVYVDVAERKINWNL
jgi:hypothetical protein